MEINEMPVSKKAEEIIVNYSFTLKPFAGIEDILLNTLQMRNEKEFDKKKFKDLLYGCLKKNGTDPKEIFYLDTDDIEIPWNEENEKILARHVRSSSTSFKQELNDIKKDIQYMLFKDAAYEELIIPDLKSMNFSNGKGSYSFSEIEEYIRVNGFMYERGANRKVESDGIKDAKIELRDDYFGKPCILLHVSYLEPSPYLEDIIPLISLSLPINPNKNYPYITTFNVAVDSVLRNKKQKK